jgi:phosphoglucomutase
MNYQEKYNDWLNSGKLTIQQEKQIKEFSEQEKEENFYRYMEFGTGGMRGKMGLGTNRMNRFVLARVNKGLANYLHTKSNNPSIVIAHDSRNNAIEFRNISAQVLASNGVKVYLFNSPAPTPQLSYAVQELKTTSGIVITASHNPPEYNGFKVYNEFGSQLIDADAKDLMNHIDQSGDEMKIEYKSFEELNQNGMIEMLDNKIDHEYIKVLKKMTGPISKDLRVVFTPLHGSTGKLVQNFLDEIGCNYRVVENQIEPNGDFPTTNSPNPEDIKVFNEAIKVAIDFKADIIIATDPDGDRLGIAAKNSSGDYELLTGNQTGGMMIDYLIEQRKQKGEMPDKPYIATTIVTSEFGTKIAQSYGVDTKLTLTGFKYIGEIINSEVGHKRDGASNYIFGYEESFGYLIKPFARDKDSLQAIALILEIASVQFNKSSTLLEKLEDLYLKHGTFYEEINSITLEGKTGMEKMSSLMHNFRSNITMFNSFGVELIEDYQQSIIFNKNAEEVSKISLPKSNVLKYKIKEGFFVIRPSGTEPKIKLYICLNGDNDIIKQKASQIMAEFMNKINTSDNE